MITLGYYTVWLCYIDGSEEVEDCIDTVEEARAEAKRYMDAYRVREVKITQIVNGVDVHVMSCILAEEKLNVYVYRIDLHRYKMGVHRYTVVEWNRTAADRIITESLRKQGMFIRPPDIRLSEVYSIPVEAGEYKAELIRE